MKKGYEVYNPCGVFIYRKKATMSIIVYGADTPPQGFDDFNVYDFCVSIRHTYSQSKDRQRLHYEIVEKCGELLKWAQSLPVLDGAGEAE